MSTSICLYCPCCATRVGTLNWMHNIAGLDHWMQDNFQWSPQKAFVQLQNQDVVEKRIDMARAMAVTVATFLEEFRSKPAYFYWPVPVSYGGDREGRISPFDWEKYQKTYKWPGITKKLIGNFFGEYYSNLILREKPFFYERRNIHGNTEEGMRLSMFHESSLSDVALMVDRSFTYESYGQQMTDLRDCFMLVADLPARIEVL